MMDFELLIIASVEEMEKYKDNLDVLDKYLAPASIVVVGDEQVGAICNNYDFKCRATVKYIDILSFNGAEVLGDIVIMYANRCVTDYYLYWELNVLPTQMFNMNYENKPVYCMSDAILDKILFVNTKIMLELTCNDDNVDLTPFERYFNYIINNYSDLYVSGEVSVFKKAGMFFKADELLEEDFDWLSKDFDLLIFRDDDELAPEYSYFFNNREYRNKLSATQIFDVVKEEAQINDDNSDNDASSYEYAFSGLIEQEVRKGNDIIICPYGVEGQYFKNLLNEKYGITECCIVDDNNAGNEAGIIGISELCNINLENKAIIVNSMDYEQNIGIVLDIYNAVKGLRIISPFGATETMVPGRKAFIEKVRELTEVKKAVTDRPYIRVGADSDGGYVMLDDCSADMKAYSYGINNDVSWDKYMADNYGMDIFMYDHTIDGLPEENIHFNYFKKGIAGTDKPEDLLFSLRTSLANNGHTDFNNLILKMDVEGAEWEMINETSSEDLGRFRQIAFELHDFDHPEKETEILSALEKMNITHFPVWIHGNNHVSAICTEDIILPTAIEILYLNRSHYDYIESPVEFPWEIDAPNTEVFPEYILGNWGSRPDNTKIVKKAAEAKQIVEEKVDMDYASLKEKLLNDIDFVGELSDRLLRVPSLFGPIERICLSPTANVQNAVINTMSGRVYVGDNSFCGHNVSIITGSHDAARIGEDRTWFPESGNDIVIGNGVWICSNAVILGPCQIGDNAVVAAGSVVLPGTKIGTGEVWAGVPATYKKKVQVETEANGENLRPKFDTIIVITPKDYQRVESNYKRMIQFLPSDRLIFVGNKEVGELVEKSDLGDKVGFICEDDLLPFDEVNKVMYEHLKEWLGDNEMPRGFTGWYYQQFLKMQYAYVTDNEYYMSWDGDTIPCKRFDMFKADGTPYMDYKHEYHAPYFETMGKLIPGLGKFIEPSFISEHMLFNRDIMKQLVDRIEANSSIPGEKFYEKIIHSIEPANIQDSYFSEFETYGSFVCITNPSLYSLREWHSFRLAGQFFDPDTISDSDYKWLSNDFEAVSFEKGMSVREDHKNLFDNKDYQEKLSARQMLEIAQEEFKDGYKEVWE